MAKRPPPKEKTNVGSLLPETAVAGLLRALRGVRPSPNQTVVRFDAPHVPDGPTRYYSPEAMIELAQRLERLAAKGTRSRVAVTAETANLWAKALRAYAARPDYDEVLDAICTGKSPCAIRATCYSCRTKANLIFQIFEGRADFSRALKRDR